MGILRIISCFILIATFSPISSQKYLKNIEILGKALSYDFYRQNSTNDSPEEDINCSSQINAIVQGFSKGEAWAMELVDSWGKIPVGILWGHILDFGNFDECNNATSPEKVGNDYVKGKYCTAIIPLSKLLPSEMNPSNIGIMGQPQEFPMELGGRMANPYTSSIAAMIGTCFPKVCSPKYLNSMIKDFLKTRLNIVLDENETIISDISCAKDYNDFDYETIDIIAIVFFSVIAILMVLSTVYDFINQKFERKPANEVFIAFSVLTNGKKLFSSPPKNSDKIIGCLNGIRCLSIVWVVIGHKYAVSQALPYLNLIKIVKWKSSPFSMLIQNANISVDTFFFMSGFLVAWIGFKELTQRKGKLNIPLMYFHRYLRLTPAIGALILFTLSILKYLGSGPRWDGISFYGRQSCETYWWSTLLYVWNYVNPDEPCLLHSWYLTVDMQLYILSPLLLIPTYKWGRKFLYPIAIIACAFSISYCFATYMTYEFNMTKPGPNDNKSNSLIYYVTHSRLSPWVVGFVLGYFMFENKTKRFNISKSFNIIAWLTSLVIMLTIVFGNYDRYQPGSVPTTLESAFYESFKRVTWAIVLSWIVFACHKGYGGVINSFLSYPFWGVMARLSYCIYLNHVLVNLIHLGIVKSDAHFSDYEVQLSLWGDLGITTLVSIVTVLAFESPILGIEKVLFGSKKSNTAATTNDNEDQIVNSCKSNNP